MKSTLTALEVIGIMHALAGYEETGEKPDVTPLIDWLAEINDDPLVHPCGTKIVADSARWLETTSPIPFLLTVEIDDLRSYTRQESWSEQQVTQLLEFSISILNLKVRYERLTKQQAAA